MDGPKEIPVDEFSPQSPFLGDLHLEIFFLALDRRERPREVYIEEKATKATNRPPKARRKHRSAKCNPDKDYLTLAMEVHLLLRSRQRGGNSSDCSQPENDGIESRLA